MPLIYDYDFQSIFPLAVYKDDTCQRLLARAGIAHNIKGNYVALFRDPVTVAALWAAPDTVKAAVLKSDFGILLFEGESDSTRDKAEFIKKTLLEHAAQSISANWDDRTVKMAVFKLHMFCKSITKGELVDERGKIRCSNWVEQQVRAAGVTEPFDVSQALDAMISDVVGRTAGGRPTPPTQTARPTPAPAPRISLRSIFGRWRQ
ncbi:MULTISPECIES: hypothetical protein [unclassified Mesorhizobium]|uniref:hypothetical protein n=1 Tax=unclassified Mesorhizobium TaxID=325217 RepID=UPI000FC9C4A7|nr:MULTISPECIES: hypothetical protein [unclassified Mesorhizobium]RUW02460.1 hypothetical protein EOA49_06710 [Mesorhizobium sp. M1A.F.Ca.IN.020.04.1.1]RUW09467.1 hypothetical protein EOA53_16545 [Mesorhizobium sp. M1A.F.Ca.IN.020.03.1.1]RWF69760.1 MAG: hypothetical protein EOQ34_21070 [Mesorhizobium sp.]RWG14402.1 MAG: hypothetical protein EOQ58_14745 [Mesorhizobium sp.]RWG29284.1 MAG: hypothetical protein EOQ61_18655 [Mesorhizobium sp.]